MVAPGSSSPERGGGPSAGWWRGPPYPLLRRWGPSTTPLHVAVPLPVPGRILAALLLTLTTPAAAQDKTPPYWASINTGEGMMRTGPGKNYPGIWLYKRRDLPIRVLKLYPNWRLIEDPDGTRGWMLVTLLSDRRTAVVKPGKPRPIYSEASETSAVKYRAEPGVVGRIEKCRDNWCKFTVGNRQGYVRVADVWGVGDGEIVD